MRIDSSGRLWPRADLRVGDADRRAVAEELQRHLVDGRLTGDELTERTAQALNARTFGELALPLGDLPVLTQAAPDERPDAPHERHEGRSMFGPALGALLVAIGVLALLWLYVLPTMHWGGLPFWPFLFVGLFVFRRSRRGGRRNGWHGEPPTQYQ